MLSRVSPDRKGTVGAKRALSVAVVAALPLVSPNVHALSYELDNGLNVEWDTSVSYGTMWRLKDQSAALIDPASFRGTGNANFDQGLVSNRLSFITEADISGEESGAFIRAIGYYDDEVKDKDLAKEVDENHGSDVRLLDTFVYTSQDWGALRIGNQVVSWGESFFLPGISALQSPIDLSKFN